MVKNVDVKKAYERRQKALEIATENIETIEKIHVSMGNSKMGAIPSFSVLPLITCKNCGECSKHCYACLNNYNYNNNVNALAENTAIIINNPNRVIEELNNFLNGLTIIYKYFRFNVAGDVFNESYLTLVIEVARTNPLTTFLVFTKNYELFNEYFRTHEKPANLTIVFSRWDNAHIDNEHNFPVAIVKVDGNTEIPENAYHCNGDCANCLECWRATNGTTRYFDIH